MYRDNYASYSNNIKIFLTTNNFDYYINLKNPNNKAAIWMYISFSSFLNWIELPSIYKYSEGSLMLNDNQLFLMGQDISTATLLHIFKITFSTATYDWGSQILCPYDCSPTYAESIQSSDSSKIPQNTAIRIWIESIWKDTLKNKIKKYEITLKYETYDWL